MSDREIKPASVGRWPWHDEVIHWTWRDSQEHHYNVLRARRNRARLMTAFFLAAAFASVATLVKWITL